MTKAKSKRIPRAACSKPRSNLRSQAKKNCSSKEARGGLRRILRSAPPAPARSTSGPFPALLSTTYRCGDGRSDDTGARGTTRARAGAATRFMVFFFFWKRRRRAKRKAKERKFMRSLLRFFVHFFLSLFLRFASLLVQIRQKKRKLKTPWPTADDTRPSCTCSRRMTWRRS